MPFRVVCPSCRRGGRVPEAAVGADVTCPACGMTYPFAAVVAAAGPEVEPDAVAPPSRAKVSRPATAPGAPEPISTPSPGGPTILYVALGISTAAVVVLIGLVVRLSGHRAEDPAIASIPETPAATDPAAAGAFEIAERPAIPDPNAAGDLVALPGSTADEANATEPAGPEEPSGAPDGSAAEPVDPVALPGRPLSTAEIVERCEPSVALIEGALGSGTGFLVRPGVVATNSHVIRGELISLLKVRFPSAAAEDSGPRPARLLFEDPERDLAFLEVETDLPPLVVARDHRYIKGEDVTVIGNPGVGDAMILENAVSKGVMSSRAEFDGREFIQLGIAINPGNSGGPVFDGNGEVIGVATLKTAEEEAMGFCIPVDDLRDAIDRVERRADGGPDDADARHRPRAIFNVLVTAGAVHAVGLNRHVIAWNEAGGGPLQRLNERKDEELRAIRDDLDSLHASIRAALNSEKRRLRDDPKADERVKDLLNRFVASYARLRELLNRPPDDLDAMLAEVSAAESAHGMLAKEIAEILGVEVDERLLAALEPLQLNARHVMAIGPGGLRSFPGLRPGFGRFRGGFGMPGMPSGGRAFPGVP